MKINVKNINDYTKEVELDVPWTTIEPDFESTIKKFSKKVKLPGFRPGKIPRDRLMQQFQPNIEAQFMDDNIHKYYLLALQERKIVPVNQAEIRDVQFQLGEHFSFTAKFEVEPDFKLPKFKNNMFKVQKNKFIPDEQDITDGINQLRRSHARIETVEDGAQEKDFILCDLQKLDESGVAIIGKKFEKQMLKVGDGSFTDDQTSKLIGLKPGESSKLDLPDNEDKTIKNPYELTVVKVEREVLPELNDDFVKMVNPELKSVDELNNDVLEKINENFAERSRQSFEKEISDALIDKIGFETPPSMVNNYLNNILEDVKKQNNGEKIDEQKVLETYRPSAERNLKWYLIRKKLIDQEQLSFSKSDIDAEVESLISRTPQSEKEIRRFYKKPSNRQRIEDDLTEKKILEYLTQFAKIKEVEVNTKDIRGEGQ
ncbi:MAG: trigger factor [Candidatus Marinimicrobia bacterium]|nr:trigger factor [Candidatus Neomarinimicrobiota bacterium]MDG1224481.1 trigger factor [Candidatus Neomarinimicrobiota bacterium]MDG1848405.1 trigger factor [Candidatus Neomarinimicrobiota bacterium]